METITTIRGSKGITDFRASRASMVKPTIKKEYKQDGVRMYKTVDGRTFIADVFDQNFNQGIKLKMKPKHFKAKSLDSRVIY